MILQFHGKIVDRMSFVDGYLSVRETVHSQATAAAKLGISAVAATAHGAVRFGIDLAKRYPRSLAASGTLAAVGGLWHAAERAGQAGTAISQFVGARILEKLTGQAAQAQELNISSAPSLVGVGIFAAGAALAAIGLRGDARRRANVDPNLPADYSAPSVSDIQTYPDFLESALERPYQLSLPERLAEGFERWATGRVTAFGALRARIRAAHAEQTRPNQPYNPFPQTTNYIGEPLLPV